ncbi:hypothetical protein JW911_03135 [Candidatus Peregrinibacteria bacterium]|nr:hypothetical protein [Candidatus Peregrinibacteria bacterium]
MSENLTSFNDLEQTAEKFQSDLFVQKLILLNIKLCELRYSLSRENDQKIIEITQSDITEEQKEEMMIKNLQLTRGQLKTFEEMIIEHIVKGYIDSDGAIFDLPEFNPEFDGRYIGVDVGLTPTELRAEVKERARILSGEEQGPDNPSAMSKRIFISLKELMEDF